jgi:hypothetical protein
MSAIALRGTTPADASGDEPRGDADDGARGTAEKEAGALATGVFEDARGDADDDARGDAEEEPVAGMEIEGRFVGPRIVAAPAAHAGQPSMTCNQPATTLSRCSAPRGCAHAGTWRDACDASIVSHADSSAAPPSGP